jgi:integral membrane protein (TIGR01906 family)
VPGRFWAFLIAAATALVILGASIVPFLTDSYIHIEQERAGAERLTGYDVSSLQAVTTSIVHDLLVGGDFKAVDSSGAPALNEREQAHMRDVRGVFQGFFALVAIGIVLLAVGFARARTPEARAALWRAVRSGARGLAVVLVVAGAFALFAFDAAFEVFHRLFFNAGSYTFDPRTDRLVQLFPEQFWSETAIAVGTVAIAVAVITAWGAGRRAGAARPAAVLSRSEAGT